jgi:hypothetical protein
MKRTLTIAAFVISALLVFAADPPTDLTGTGPELFKQNVGKTVSLSGRLEYGKQGFCLWGSAATNVLFYAMSDTQDDSAYAAQATWERLLHKQVRVTGELKFRSFERDEKNPLVQQPPNYYYMAIQGARIEKVDVK